jgi:hypothetical protein
MRAVVFSIGLLAALSGCSRSPAIENLAREGGWSYDRVASRSSTDTTTYVYLLSYHTRSVTIAGRLITPFGTLVNAAREDPHSDSGWIKWGPVDSRTISASPQIILPTETTQGFYSSPIARKRNTPSDWVYVVDAEPPGWEAPDKLFDERFNRKHKYVWNKSFSSPLTTTSLDGIARGGGGIRRATPLDFAAG